MSFGIRYIILAGVNCLLMMGYLLMMLLMKWDLSKRLIDLDVAANKQDAIMLFSLLGILLVALIVNVLLMSLPKRQPTLDEVEQLISSLTKELKR